MYYVYVIKNEDGGIYIGCTSDLEARLDQHNNKHKGYTNNKQWTEVYHEAYLNKEDAIDREKKLKQHGQTKRRLLERISRSKAGK